MYLFIAPRYTDSHAHFMQTRTVLSSMRYESLRKNIFANSRSYINYSIEIPPRPLIPGGMRGFNIIYFADDSIEETKDVNPRLNKSLLSPGLGVN